MSLPAEHEHGSLINKQSVLPAKESDSPRSWFKYIQFLGDHVKTLTFMWSKRWVAAKVAQEEAKAAATMLDAQGLYQERLAKSVREKAAAEGELASAEKIREEARTQRIQNDQMDPAQLMRLATEIMGRINSSISLVRSDGGSVGFELPNIEEPKQIASSGDPATRVVTASGEGHASKEPIEARMDAGFPAIEAQVVIDLGPIPRYEVRPGTITQSPPPEKPELRPVVGTSAAQAQPATVQAYGTVGKSQTISTDSAVAKGILEESHVSSLNPVEPEHREPTPQEPQKKEPPSVLPPTFEMGLKIGMD